MATEECTWTFEAVGNCTLEFRTEDYERADVDCSEQYLLVGDEYPEKRYARPVRRVRER